MRKQISKNFNNKIFIIAFAMILIIITSSYAKCTETKREIYAPAVINENASQMIKIMIETKNVENNSAGRIFYALKPVIGTETQNSIMTADKMARRIAEENGVNASECNVFVTISNGDVSYIEGPSAGALFTVLILSGFENKKIKNDTTMTGTIEENGAIGSVGGLTLKSEAAYKLNFKQIIIPPVSNSEKIELLMLKNYYNITILQASTIREAYEIMTSARIKQENLSLSPESLQEYQTAVLQHPYKDWIQKVTEKMIEDAKNGLNSTPTEYKENFESRLKNSENAYNASQYYTSANIAFLLSIDKEVSLFSKQRLINEYQETKDCIKEFESLLEQKQKNSENFQIIGPAETRYMWAKTKLNQAISEDEIFNMSVRGDENGFISPLLTKYKDIVTSKYWCLAAIHMINEMPDENISKDKNTMNKDKGTVTYFNESSLKNYAGNVLSGLQDVDPDNSDAVFHLQSAKQAYKEERYLSALVDAAYVKSYKDIANLQAKGIDQGTGIKNLEIIINSQLDSMYNKSHEFIWPQIFLNHAKAVSKDDPLSALRIAFIATNIEKYFKDAETIQNEGMNSSQLRNNENISELVIGDNTINETEKAKSIEESNKKVEEIYAYQIMSIITFVLGTLFVAFIILFVIGRVKPSDSKNSSKKKKMKR